MRSIAWFLFVVVLALTRVGGGTAFAEAHAKDAPHVASDKHAPGNAHGHKPGSDDPMGGELNQILDLAIWTILVFLILLAVLGKFAWKPMLAALRQREDNIRGALAEAEKARDEALSIRRGLQKDMDEAHLQVKAIIDEGKRDAQVVADDLLAKAKADIGGERERMQREIQTATDQALHTLWVKAAELATQASSKAIRKQLDGDGHRKLIDEALKELQTAGANGHA